MNTNDARGAVAASIVLDALIREATDPGSLQKLSRAAEVLFRILEDTDDPTRERLTDSIDALALVVTREIEKSKNEGRFPDYP